MLRSFIPFSVGVLRHGWGWFVLVCLDLADAYQLIGKFILPQQWQNLEISAAIFWSIVGLGIFWSALKTYDELRIQNEENAKGLEKRIDTLEDRLAPKIESVRVDIEQQGISPPNNPSKMRQGNFIKLAVRNIGMSTVHNCQAWVCDISFTGIGNNESGSWPSGMTDVQLEWSGTNVGDIDLANKKIAHITLLHSSEDSDELRFWKIPTPNNMLGFFTKFRIYKITLQITGEDVPTEEAIIQIKWTGDWDKVTATLLNGAGIRK